ncbi:MAG: tyrosine-type recombinase/integrase [Alphaproteobacteria bacterium]
MTKLTKGFVKQVPYHEKEKTYWDDRVKGFGLRVRKHTKSWIVMYRNAEGIIRKLTLGHTDKLNATEARKIAKKRLAEVIMGRDPAVEKADKKKYLKVSELCDLYIREGCENKKISTIKMDISRIERHIKPLIGNMPVNSLTTAVIEKMMVDIAQGKTAFKRRGKKLRSFIKVRGGKTVASRTVGMFGSILEFARRRDIIEHNPSRGVKKYSDNKKDFFLNFGDIEALSRALLLAEKQGINKIAINAIKLLLLTGCRKNEILTLKWEYVDLKNKCFRFPDTKTGKQTRCFGQGALHLLQELKKKSHPVWVFPSHVSDCNFKGISKIFKRICRQKDPKTGKAFLKPEISIHTLRHSFASLGADMGFIELTIAGLLGHNLGGVTNRYSHNVDSSLISAADKISLRIEKALSGERDPMNNIYELRKAK